MPAVLCPTVTSQARSRDVLLRVAAGVGGELAAALQIVVLRCGLPRPAELTPTSALLEVNGVRWLTLSDGALVTSIAVDRPVYVQLTVPSSMDSASATELSTVIGDTLPAQPRFQSLACRLVNARPRLCVTSVRAIQSIPDRRFQTTHCRSFRLRLLCQDFTFR